MPILYRNDLCTTRAMIHTNTKNSSFIRMAIVLKRMGIQNNQFFLALHQPELADVDPHSPNLSPEIISKIMVEVKLNPWYFFREVLKIPIAGGEVIPFQLHRGNLAAIWTFLNDIDYGLIQPRQTGKTFCTQSIMTYFMYILAQSATIAMITKDQVLLTDNVQRLKELRDTLPPYMVVRSTKDWDRKEGVSYAEFKNYYRTATSPIDERSAYRVLRGSSPALIHFDEIAFIQYNWIMVPSIVNATLAAADQVRATGVPCPLIYTTTAGDPAIRSSAYALQLFQEALPFSEQLYDCHSREDLLHTIDQSGSRRMLYLEFSYRQLGKTDEWFKYASTRTTQTAADVARDLLNAWISSTDKAILPQRTINLLRENKREPNFIDYGEGTVIRWYIDKTYMESPDFKNLPLVMGMDTSENVGRDFTTFVILDPRDMKVLATCRCNLINTMSIGKMVVNMLKKFPKLLWIPERNNTGIGIIDFVMDQLQSQQINPFLRIYNEVVQNYDDPKYQKIDIYDFMEIYGQTRAAFGFRTTGRTRDVLYKQVLMKYVDMNHSRIYDANLINELCNLTEKNGRIDHPEGCHDDTVIASILAAWVIYFGRNLNLYGIPPSAVLQLVAPNGDMVPPGVKEEQIAIRRRINELETLLATQPANILKQSYLRELAVLRPQVDENIMQIDPIAHTQVKFQEKQIAGQMHIGGPEAALRSFVNRYRRAV